MKGYAREISSLIKRFILSSIRPRFKPRETPFIVAIRLMLHLLTRVDMSVCFNRPHFMKYNPDRLFLIIFNPHFLYN